MIGRRGSCQAERLEHMSKANFPANINSFAIGCKLSNSHFDGATFHLAKRADIKEDNLYVIRNIDAEKLTMKELQLLQSELQLSSRLNHANLVKFYSCFVVNNGHIYTVYPLSNYGSCHDLIGVQYKHGLPVNMVAIIIRSVVLALEYLHSLRIIHRAVKASHILLNSEGNVSLTGIRYSIQLPANQKITHHLPDHGLHILPWIAPEVVQQNLNGYNTSSDIYSLGITAVELVTGAVPYNKLRPTEILLQKLKGVVPQLPDSATIEEMHCDFSSSLNSLDGLEATNDMMSVGSSASVSNSLKRVRNLQQFVDVSLQSEPSLRPLAAHLKSSPYLKNIKRKIKERMFPSFQELLKDAQPITEFIPNKDDSSSEMDLVVKKVPSVTLDDKGEAWVF